MSTYYRIIDRNIIGRQDGSGACYIYDKINGWVPDSKNILQNRIAGFDEFEEPDSPYRYFNSDMMFRIEEITEDEENKIINGYMSSMV